MPSWWWRTSIAISRRARRPIEAAVIGAREIVGPVIAMTITLAAVYAPIGFLAGLTGALFREFAFTLAGAVIISGIVAVTLSPMMCSMLLTREMSQGLVCPAGRPVLLRRHPLVRPPAGFRPSITGRSPCCSRPPSWSPVGFLYTHSNAELAPPEDQGVIFAVGKGPQYSNLDYTDIYSKQLDEIYRSVSRDRGHLRGQRLQRPQQQHFGHDPEALGRAQAQRQRS